MIWVNIGTEKCPKASFQTDAMLPENTMQASDLKTKHTALLDKPVRLCVVCVRLFGGTGSTGLLKQELSFIDSLNLSKYTSTVTLLPGLLQRLNALHFRVI